MRTGRDLCRFERLKVLQKKFPYPPELFLRFETQFLCPLQLPLRPLRSNSRNDSMRATTPNVALLRAQLDFVTIS
jgi:hypothetical protein